MKILFFTLVLIFTFSLTNAQAVDSKKDSTAFAAVNSWLKIVDEKEYAKSYDEASEMFKKTLTKEQWVNAVALARGPFEELIKREINNKKYNNQLPGLPDGDYYSFEFNTSFEKKKQSIETITAVLEKDNWKVVGYFIR